MEECLSIIDQTIDGLMEFFIRMGGDRSLVRQIDYNCLHDIVVEWLKVTTLDRKETAIQSFIQQVPQLHSYAYLIQNSLVVHEELWNTVFYNLLKCQMLIR